MEDTATGRRGLEPELSGKGNREMTSFFGGKDKAGGAATENGRVSRHSSGWGQLLQRLRGEESLRVLDIGPTSSTNINFITELGHSIYLANLVEDAAKHDWSLPRRTARRCASMSSGFWRRT